MSATELHELARRLVESWNLGNAHAFAGLFTIDAEYVTGSGERLRGREAISQLLDGANFPPQVQLVGEPVAECDATHGRVSFAWSTVGASEPVRRGRITCTCVRQESAWLIEALHNDEAG